MPGGPPWLFDHVVLPVRDLARSRAFYERALQPLGVRVVESSQGPGFAIGDQDFWIGEHEMAAGRCTLRSPRKTARPLTRSTLQPSRREGSTTDGPGGDLAITPRTTPHTSSTPMGTT